MPRPLTNAESRQLTRAIRTWEKSLSREKPMTQAAYARSRGLSRQYIGRCIEYGIIHRAIIETETGRRLLDPAAADQELADNRPGQIRIDRL